MLYEWAWGDSALCSHMLNFGSGGVLWALAISSITRSLPFWAMRATMGQLGYALAGGFWGYLCFWAMSMGQTELGVLVKEVIFGERGSLGNVKLVVGDCLTIKFDLKFLIIEVFMLHLCLALLLISFESHFFILKLILTFF